MVELLRKEKIYTVVLDYCQYGEKWPKSTQLVTNRPELLALGRRCRGSLQRCSATKRAHQVLRGLAPSGELWTKVACPYPEEMCRAYAEAIEDQAPEVSGRPVPGARKEVKAQVMTELDKNWRDIKRWKMLFRGDWRLEEHNNILEARGVVAVLRHLARSSTAWHHRVLIFTDSMVSLGCLAKGRSSARGLLLCCRASAAVQPLCGIKSYLRWVPGEINYADGPSRGEMLGVAKEIVQAHRLRGLSRRMGATIGRCSGEEPDHGIGDARVAHHFRRCSTEEGEGDREAREGARHQAEEEGRACVAQRESRRDAGAGEPLVGALRGRRDEQALRKFSA